jgi:hypothetical protein
MTKQMRALKPSMVDLACDFPVPVAL